MLAGNRTTGLSRASSGSTAGVNRRVRPGCRRARREMVSSQVTGAASGKLALITKGSAASALFANETGAAILKGSMDAHTFSVADAGGSASGTVTGESFVGTLVSPYHGTVAIQGSTENCLN